MNEAPASAPIVAPPSSFAPEVAARLHQDIKHLSETIGPRGSATDDEAKAAHYVAERLTALGLDPQRQDFKGAASAYAP